MQRLPALASVDAAAWLEFLHRLFQLTATIAILDRTEMDPRISLGDLVARLESAEHTIARETLVIVDRIKGYWLATDVDAAGGALVVADNAPDLYIKLLWRRFGLAVSYEGELKEIDPDTGFFCVGLEEQRELWCRFSQARSNGFPATGTKVRLFGWIKWNSQIMEVLELTPLDPKT